MTLRHIRIAGAAALAVLGALTSACGASVDGNQWKSVSIRNDTQTTVQVRTAAATLAEIAPNQSLPITVNVNNDPQQVKLVGTAECIIVKTGDSTSESVLPVS